MKETALLSRTQIKTVKTFLLLSLIEDMLRIGAKEGEKD